MTRPNIHLPKKPERMPDNLWGAYVEAHEYALNKMEAKGSTDKNYYYKLMQKRLGNLPYNLCLKYFRMDVGF